MGLAVLFAVLWDSCQNPLGLCPKDGELRKISGIEQHIGLFLERIDPPDLRTTDIGPVGDSLACGESALQEVPDNAPQQPVVAGWNAVMEVERDRSDGVDEYLELLIGRDFLRQFRVQGMDAFYQKDRPVRKRQFLPVKLPQASDEIEFRNLNLLSGK